jgi:hypothetical protein
MSTPDTLMAALKTLAGLAFVGAIAGCYQQKPAVSPYQQSLMDEMATHPIGRFDVAGKREYVNGTEVYVLDTKTGQVCYFFVASGHGGSATDQKTDMGSCAGDALAPE